MPETKSEIRASDSGFSEISSSSQSSSRSQIIVKQHNFDEVKPGSKRQQSRQPHSSMKVHEVDFNHRRADNRKH